MRRFIDQATVFLASLILLVALFPDCLHAQAATLDREAANAQLLNGDRQPFGFSGYVKDPETGLYYAGARYYDPAIGRFTTEDPLAGDVMKPPSLHRYLYSYANPTTYVDPDGRQALPAMGQAEAMALAWGSEDRDEMRRNALGAAAGQLDGAKLSLPVIAGTFVGTGLVSGLRAGWLAYRASGVAAFGLTVAAQRGAPYAEAAAEMFAGVPNPVSTLPTSPAALPARIEAQEGRLASELPTVSAAAIRTEAGLVGHSEVPLANPPAVPLAASPPRQDTVTVTEGMDVAAAFSLPRATGPPATRPTPRQSEIDVGNDLGETARPQVSYLNGEEVRYGTKGSSRPDFCIGTSCSFEVKNYDIANNTPGLVSMVVTQAIQRQQNLPQGMTQRVIIDVRGQTVTPRQEAEIVKSIVLQSNGAITPTSVQFKYQ